jgi:hypothetical protein
MGIAMDSWILPVLILVVWLVLTQWLLPKLGIPT